MGSRSETPLTPILGQTRQTCTGCLAAETGRFSALEHDDGERLLCTAEAAAELLDEIVGDSGGGEELRGVLAQFQQEVRSGVPGPASGGVNPAARPAA